MKLVLKVVLALVVLLVLVMVGGIVYLKTAFPKVGPASDIRVEGTPEQIARGRYLANHVTICIDCHSERDWQYFAAPPVPGSEGKGGEVFPEEAGFPGTLIAPNITPAALGNWTDGDIIRATVSGVNKSGQALFPLMPYSAYAQMTEDDVHALVAYLRTLPPIDHIPPRSSLKFPMSIIVNTIPKPYQKPEPVDRSNTLAYGKYLTTIAACAECHTQQDHGQPLPGMDYAGGFDFPLPTGKHVRSANITPDMQTGIGSWKREFFIARFKQFDKEESRTIPLQDGITTVMPWTMYAGMTEEDLGAIYDYLRTVPPVKHEVNKFPE